MSSGDSELAALVVAKAEGMGLRKIAEDAGTCPGEKKTKTLIVARGIAAAIAITKRRGAPGKARHIEVRALFLQEALRQENALLVKVSWVDNAAGVLAKVMPESRLLWRMIGGLPQGMPVLPKSLTSAQLNEL